jgi:hypothetical protein
LSAFNPTLFLLNVMAEQMQARPRHQRGQALHELQRRHHNVRGAVAPGALELQHDVSSAIALESFVGDRGTRDVPAQALEFLALMGGKTPPTGIKASSGIACTLPRAISAIAGVSRIEIADS